MPYKDPKKQKESSGERWKTWAKRNPEQANRRMKEWRTRNPEYMLVVSANRRAKRDGIICELTRETCPKIPSHCPITGIPLFQRDDGGKGPCDNSPTIDRIDPTKGYTVENTCIISHRANRWKSNMTVENLESLLAYMKNNKKGTS